MRLFPNSPPLYTCREWRPNHYRLFWKMTTANCHSLSQSLNLFQLVNTCHEVWRTRQYTMFLVWRHQCPVYGNKRKLSKDLGKSAYARRPGNHHPNCMVFALHGVDRQASFLKPTPCGKKRWLKTIFLYPRVIILTSSAKPASVL